MLRARKRANKAADSFSMPFYKLAHPLPTPSPLGPQGPVNEAPVYSIVSPLESHCALVCVWVFVCAYECAFLCAAAAPSVSYSLYSSCLYVFFYFGCSLLALTPNKRLIGGLAGVTFV